MTLTACAVLNRWSSRPTPVKYRQTIFAGEFSIRKPYARSVPVSLEPTGDHPFWQCHRRRGDRRRRTQFRGLVAPEQSVDLLCERLSYLQNYTIARGDLPDK